MSRAFFIHEEFILINGENILIRHIPKNMKFSSDQDREKWQIRDAKGRELGEEERKAVLQDVKLKRLLKRINK